MKKCLQCGAEMPDEEVFCSECGAEAVLKEVVPEPAMEEAVITPNTEIVEAATATEEPSAVPEEEVKLEDVPDGAEEAFKPVESISEKPISKKKVKWWHIAVPVAAVVAIIATLLLGPFFIYLSPKTVLARALAATGEDLSARAEGTPLTVMSNAYDDTQKNSITMNIDASQPTVGEIHIGMDAKIDNSTRQSQVGIRMDWMGQEMDMNLYMDREVAAINVDMITGKDYYGIYYDTFGQDIRNNEFMYESLGEDNIEMYEELVDMAGQTMNLEVPTPEQQAESLKKYGDAILDFVIQTDASIEKASVSLDGKEKNCKAVSFVISHEEYAELFEELIDIAETDPLMIYYYQASTMVFSEDDWKEALDDLREDLAEFKEEGDGECEIIFYLHGGKIVQIDVAINDDSDGEWGCSVNFGSDATQTDIIISGYDGEAESSFELILATEKDDDVVIETLYITESEDGKELLELELGYEWNRKSGDLCLYFQEGEGESGELNCVLEELKNGYRFSIPAIQDLIESMGEDAEGVEMSMDITMTTGAEIEVPESIKDIAKMTQADMMKIASKLMDM